MTSRAWETADLGRMLRFCILIGYPCAAVISTILPQIQGEASILYRAFVLALSFGLLFVALGRLKMNAGFLLIQLFLFAYLLRLILDLTTLDEGAILSTLLFFVGLVLVPVTAVMVCGLRDESDEKLARLLVGVGMFLMLFFCLIWVTGRGYNPWDALYGTSTDRLALETLNAISMAQAAVAVALAGVALLINFRVRGPARLWVIATVLLALFVIYLSNSRGPILSGGAALLWLAFGRLRKSWIILAALAGGGGYLLLFTGLLDNIIGRFNFDIVTNLSNLERVIVQQAAIEAFLASPAFGAFSVDVSFPPGNYPHNLLIETAMALGVFGLGILLVTLVYAGFRVMRFYNAEHPLLTALLVHFFIGMQFSGSIFAADGFFMALGLAAVTRPRKRPATLRQQAPQAGATTRQTGLMA